MPLVEDDDVVEEFPTKAANHPLHIGILPRRARGRDDLIDARAFNPSRSPLTVNAIAVSNQITWSRNDMLIEKRPPGGRRRFVSTGLGLLHR